jgi:hypothetical protein
MCKHSSLFVQIVSDEEKKFYNVYNWNAMEAQRTELFMFEAKGGIQKTSYERLKIIPSAVKPYYESK